MQPELREGEALEDGYFCGHYGRSRKPESCWRCRILELRAALAASQKKERQLREALRDGVERLENSACRDVTQPVIDLLLDALDSQAHGGSDA